MALRAVIDHPKFARLKMLLRTNKSITLGYLEGMWHFCGRYTSAGNIGKYKDSEIEAWLEWGGEEGTLVAAYVEAGWIDCNEQHRLVVHDWSQYADEIVHTDLARKCLTFADGALPKTGRLNKHERERFFSAFPDIKSHPSPRFESNPDISQTQSDTGQTKTDSVTKPEPEPEPEPAIRGSARAPAYPPSAQTVERKYDFGADDIPEGLDAMQYARGMLETLNIPHAFATQTAASSAITAYAKEHGAALHRSTGKLMALARDAIARGEPVNRFWFEDAKWRVNANAVQRGGGGDAGNRFNQAGGSKTLGNRKADRASGALARAQARILAANGAHGGVGEDVPQPWRGDGRGPA
jgi:hypothetical protein